MKRTILAALAVAAAALATAPPAAAQAQTMPFTLRWDTVSIPGMPALQSFARAASGGRWLLLTGRRAGLHGFGAPPVNNFPPTEMNDSIYVVDPAAAQVWSMSVGWLPDSVADLLRVTNAQFAQNGNTLYVVGGYGMNSSTGRMMTMPTLMAINVPTAIAAVAAGDTAGMHRAITFSHDWRLAVTGGEMQRLGNTYYLIFGQQFDGLYDPVDANIGVTFTQRYTEQIARFTLVSSGGAPAIGQYYAPYTTTAANRPYHRRDLTSAPIMSSGGTAGLGIYGGVFAPGNDSTYRQAVYVASAGAAPQVDGYNQFMSQYTGAVLPAFSNSSSTMYTTFFGGISLHQVNRAATPNTLVRNDTVPFVSAVTTLVRRPDGSSFECVWADSLPGLLGAEAVIIPAPGVPDFENEVVRLDSVTAAIPVGYFFGGIRAQAPNFGASTASSLVMRVTLTPQPGTCAVTTATPPPAAAPQRGPIRRRP